MKVSELIEVLQSLPQNSLVYFQYNYGDYWRTQVANSVDSVETGNVKWSDYHSMHKVVESDDEDEAPEDVEGAVLLG